MGPLRQKGEDIEQPIGRPAVQAVHLGDVLNGDRHGFNQM
jgi:hypothetical protein